MNRNYAIIWNRKTRLFAIVSPDLASAMIQVGNTSGFDAVNHTSRKLDKVTIMQDGRKCRVEIEKGGVCLTSEPMGRVKAKRLASFIHEIYSTPLFNIKADGKLVLLSKNSGLGSVLI